MKFLLVLLALALPAFGQTRIYPTSYTGPFMTNRTAAEARAYLGISGSGGSGLTNYSGLATNMTFYGTTLQGSTTNASLTASTVPYLDANKVFTSSAVTPTELGYLSGVSSAIQTQLGARLPLAGGTMTGNLLVDTGDAVGGISTFDTAIEFSFGGYGMMGFRGTRDIATYAAAIGGGSGGTVGGVAISSTSFLSWGSTANPVTSASDIILARDAAGTLAQRNGVANPQTNRLYHTFSDASNHQRLALYTTTNSVNIAAETAGTGADDLDVKVFPAGVGSMSVTVGGAVAKVGGTIFAQTTTNETTNVDSTEDNLYSVTLAANTFSANLQSVVQVEHVNFVANATAGRQVKKYFGGTEIWDSSALSGLSLGADFTITTHLIRHSSSVVMALVEVTSTSASAVPYAVATTVTGLTLSNTQILKTAGIADGVGAAAGDITNDRIVGKWYPAP